MTGKRSGYDPVLHLNEPLTHIRNAPVQQRLAYMTDLDRQATEKQLERQVSLGRLSRFDRGSHLFPFNE